MHTVTNTYRLRYNHFRHFGSTVWNLLPSKCNVVHFFRRESNYFWITDGYLNIIKYAMIWCHSHMINNTPNINQFQHNNFTTYIHICLSFHILLLFSFFFSAMLAPAPTVLLNIRWSETEIGTHKPIWLLVPFVTYTLWYQLLVLVLI